MTPDEQHELDCLRARVAQIAYPCSPHCDGYLRELATRNTTGFLTEPDDAWAERYCTYVGWEPDGSQVSFNSDGMASISFREMAKNHIKAAQQAWFSTRAETAQSSEAPPVSPSEASAGNLPPDEPNYKALYTELKEEGQLAFWAAWDWCSEYFRRHHDAADEMTARIEAEQSLAELKEERDRAHRLLDTYDQARTEGEGAQLEVLTLSGRILNLETDRRCAEQALSDLKREVLEKVGPFAETAAVLGNSKDSAVWAGQKPAPPLTFGHFRALSTLHDKLSSDVFPESPSGDVSTHAAGEGGVLDWLTGRINLSLEFDWPDEGEPGEWQVHRVSGSVNDREWELVGAGATPLDALRAARTALAPLPNPSARGEL